MLEKHIDSVTCSGSHLGNRETLQCYTKKAIPKTPSNKEGSWCVGIMTHLNAFTSMLETILLEVTMDLRTELKA